HWLKENLTKHLKLKAGSVEVMHGGLPDHQQMQLVDDFKKTDSPIRVLITGDVASEGVNLHTLCHDLVHYDIPWSLIRIQQRNGRIDRYGQTESPMITTLLLDPSEGYEVGELHVLMKLIEREHEANALLGDVSSLMGKHSARLEEEAIRDVLRGERDFDETVANPEDILDVPTSLDDIDALLAQIAADEADHDDEDYVTGGEDLGSVRNLYADEHSFLLDCLMEGFNNVPHSAPAQGGVGYAQHANGIAELTPTDDLRRRLDFLPQDYLSDRGIKDQFLLATSLARGQERLKAARTGEDGSTWPSAHFLGPLHPVTDWAADRALSTMTRAEIPAVTGDVAEPTVLLMSTLSNKRGQVISRSFVASTGPLDAEVLPDPRSWLKKVGVHENAVNAGNAQLPFDPDSLIQGAVQAARGALRPPTMAARHAAETRVEHWTNRAHAWNVNRENVAPSVRTKRAAKLIDEQTKLTAALSPERDLIRPLVVILPNPSTNSSEV